MMRTQPAPHTRKSAGLPPERLPAAAPPSAIAADACRLFKRQRAHINLGITSIPAVIDRTESIGAVEARRDPVVPVDATLHPDDGALSSVAPGSGGEKRAVAVPRRERAGCGPQVRAAGLLDETGL